MFRRSRSYRMAPMQAGVGVVGRGVLAFVGLLPAGGLFPVGGAWAGGVDAVGVAVNLSAYAGKTVEISIAYASDWATQGIGVFLDDITLPDGTSTSFEAGLDGWAVTGPPEGSASNVNNFTRTDASGFPVGNAIATPHSLLLGFGLEGVSTEAERNAVMGRVLDHLLEQD